MKTSSSSIGCMWSSVMFYTDFTGEHHLDYWDLNPVLGACSAVRALTDQRHISFNFTRFSLLAGDNDCNGCLAALLHRHCLSMLPS
jgi:hypothetical protein